MTTGPADTATDARDTFPKLLAERARTSADRPAYREKEYGIWQSHSWAHVAGEIRLFAAGLADLGFRRGDRLIVVGDNRPLLYWSMCAAQSLGGVPVPVYQDSVADELAYVVEHAGAADDPIGYRAGRLALGAVPALPDLSGHPDVVPGREGTENLETLEGSCDSLPRTLVRLQIGDVRSVEVDSPFVHGLEAAYDVEQRRLPRPVGTDEARNRSGRDVQVYIGERAYSTEAHSNAENFEKSQPSKPGQSSSIDSAVLGHRRTASSTFARHSSGGCSLRM